MEVKHNNATLISSLVNLIHIYQHAKQETIRIWWWQGEDLHNWKTNVAWPSCRRRLQSLSNHQVDHSTQRKM